MQVNINLIKGYLGFVVEKFCIVERKIEGFYQRDREESATKRVARVSRGWGVGGFGLGRTQGVGWFF